MQKYYILQHPYHYWQNFTKLSMPPSLGCLSQKPIGANLVLGNTPLAVTPSSVTGSGWPQAICHQYMPLTDRPGSILRSKAGIFLTASVLSHLRCFLQRPRPVFIVLNPANDSLQR